MNSARRLHLQRRMLQDDRDLDGIADQLARLPLATVKVHLPLVEFFNELPRREVAAQCGVMMPVNIATMRCPVESLYSCFNFLQASKPLPRSVFLTLVKALPVLASSTAAVTHLFMHSVTTLALTTERPHQDSNLNAHIGHFSVAPSKVPHVLSDF
jgi:hypothetical protein